MAEKAKKKNNGREKKQEKKKDSKQSSQTREIYGVIFILIGLLLFISLFVSGDNLLKRFADSVLRGTFGIGAYIFPFIVITVGYLLIRKVRTVIEYGKFTTAVLMFLSIIGLIHMIFSLFNDTAIIAGHAEDFSGALKEAFIAGKRNIGMGAFAELYTYPLTRLVSIVGTALVYMAMIIISFVILFRLSLSDASEKMEDKVKKTGEKVKNNIREANERRYNVRRERNYNFVIGEDDEKKEKEETGKAEAKRTVECIDVFEEEAADKAEIEDGDDFETPPIPDTFEVSQVRRRDVRNVPIFDSNVLTEDVAEEDDEPQKALPQEKTELEKAYQTPPITLLNAPQAKKANVQTDHSEKIEMMESTLESFGIKAWVENITVGPAITRYELSIERGTRVNKILSLSDDIALSMAAVGVRIEAPIPGKSAIGIEIPNEAVSMVTLREVLESEAFRSHKSPVAVGLGKDITGTPIIADLAKMPHLLIAGQTGSGKSVCINSIITSLLYKASPKEVKLILVDPKKVELSVYNGIPHLLTPVVSDPKKAAGALQFVVREMEKRYEMFAKRKVKEIVRYNEVMTENGEEIMPRIVVIVDELNDLMLVAKGEVEDSVMRIAQLARAAGIYLILATQRPSVNVITGVIKANIPSRIAFAVASGIDSKTILDCVGAEKLVGKGDMLYHLSGESKPARIQGAFVGEQEIEKVVEHIKSTNAETKYISEEQLIMRELKPNKGTGENTADAEESEGEDDLFPAAVEYAIECGSVSISALQRRFKVGYARAGRLIDNMEMRNIVEESQGSKPRRVLMTREEFWAMYDERLD